VSSFKFHLPDTFRLKIVAFLEWTGTLDPGEPFLSVIHFYDPHIPYDPPAPYDTMFASAVLADISTGFAQIDTMQAVNTGAAELSMGYP